MQAAKGKVMHSSAEALMQFFEYKHLPDGLAEVSRPFCDLAEIMVLRLPSNAETTVCLRKLLEAKDCAVRSMLSGPK